MSFEERARLHLQRIIEVKIDYRIEEWVNERTGKITERWRDIKTGRFIPKRYKYKHINCYMNIDYTARKKTSNDIEAEIIMGGWIREDKMPSDTSKLKDTDYGRFLLNLMEDEAYTLPNFEWLSVFRGRWDKGIDKAPDEYDADAYTKIWRLAGVYSAPHTYAGKKDVIIPEEKLYEV